MPTSVDCHSKQFVNFFSAMSVVCEICTEKQAKYKCPACSRQTCSLECVRRHKVDTSCTGKRPRTEKVAMKDFKDSILIKGMIFLTL